MAFLHHGTLGGIPHRYLVFKQGTMLILFIEIPQFAFKLPFISDARFPFKPRGNFYTVLGVIFIAFVSHINTAIRHLLGYLHKSLDSLSLFLPSFFSTP